MPRYTQETAKAKAKILTKLYAENNLNQSRVAEKEGVTRAAINQRFKQPIVKKTFAEMMDKAGMSDAYLRKKIKEGLEATRVVGYLNNKVDGVQKVSDEFVEVPDMHCRHKYLTTALEVKGIIKYNGNGKGGNQVVIIRIEHPDKLLTPAQAELISPQRSQI